MNLSGSGDGDARKDAIFLSPHKFVGGPGTPGILVAKKKLFANRVPSVPAAARWPTSARSSTATSRTSCCARKAARRRSSARSAPGWSFSSRRRSVPTPSCRREHEFIGEAIESWSAHPNIRVLGNPRATRLGIVSFMVEHGDRFLHHNFVVALLNDLFGIQARGGCSCAGPYGHRLLGHRPDPVQGVRAGDPPGLRGGQAGLGAGELQLLHLERGLRLHPRGGEAGRRARAGSCCRCTISSRRQAGGATATGCRGR